MAPTIQWLLKQSKEDRQFICLAGKNGISNPIQGINIMDNPDTVPWLKSNELVLSTGYIFTSTDIYKTIIRSLHEQGCSGLGIKMHRYMDSIPEEMIKQANDLNFPIFSIPFSSTMEEIVNLVYYQMFRNEMSESEQWMIIYRDIMETALKYHKAVPVLKKISTTLHLPVFLTSSTFQILDYFIAPNSGITFPFPFNKESNYMFTDSACHHLLENINGSSKPVIEHSIVFQEMNYQFYIYPIYQKKQLSGFFICLSVNEHLSGKQHTIITNIQSILEIVLIRNQIAVDNRNAYRESFYQTILSGVLKNHTEIELCCRQYGFDFISDRVCMVLRSEKYKELTLLKQKSFINKLVESIYSIQTNFSFEFHYTIYNHDLVGFLYPRDKQLIQKSDWLKELAEELSRQIHTFDPDCMFGFSRILHGAETIQQSYTEALRAANLGKSIHKDQSVFYYYDDLIYHMLATNMTTSQLYDYYETALKPLDDYDRSNNTCLMQTLYTYLQCGQNISKTAKKLYIHRNTMIHRMEQIKELLPLNLKNVDHTYLIQTAFYAKKLL
ncbi:MAG: PucR family transcriptional regulator ligand-binding domain-containing protein [Lachnospiraceae bacterium]|nr:PucR family transcriptional regulator ligand-binding domain-containing protein [Lachnospiraceae bacterium]